jgi:hypothetical protein
MPFNYTLTSGPSVLRRAYEAASECCRKYVSNHLNENIHFLSRRAQDNWQVKYNGQAGSRLVRKSDISKKRRPICNFNTGLSDESVEPKVLVNRTMDMLRNALSEINKNKYSEQELGGIKDSLKKCISFYETAVEPSSLIVDNFIEKNVVSIGSVLTEIIQPLVGKKKEVNKIENINIIANHTQLKEALSTIITACFYGIKCSTGLKCEVSNHESNYLLQFKMKNKAAPTLYTSLYNNPGIHRAKDVIKRQGFTVSIHQVQGMVLLKIKVPSHKIIANEI